MKNIKKASFKAALLTGLLASGLFCTEVNASSFVSSAGALGANDYIDWGVLGGEYLAIASGTSLLSNNGLTMTVSTSNGSTMERRDQSSGWAGNFTPGDKLLWNHGGGGDIIIDFATGIYGFGGGAQVQSDFFGSFTGTISAYDSLLNSLGSFGFSGTSTSSSDGSAVFAGIYDPTGSISRIVFHTTDQYGGNDFAINKMLLNTQVVPTGHGAPDATATLPLLGLALTGLGLLRRKFGSN